MGDISTTSTDTTSDRLSTAGKDSSVVKYVFSNQASSFPSRSTFGRVRDELKLLRALDASCQRRSHLRGRFKLTIARSTFGQPEGRRD